MNIVNQERVDNINSKLRKALAISDLMSCMGDIPLNEGTIQELGIQLRDLIQSSITELEEFCKD